MVAAVSNLLHFDSTPGMVRAAHVAHARSCARFEAQRVQQEARSASGLVSVSTTCTNLCAGYDFVCLLLTKVPF